MPSAPARACSHCGTATVGPCPCRSAVRRMADVHRGSAHDRGYTARWQRARVAWLRHHPRCGDRESGQPVMSRCRDEGRVTPAEVLDHVVPHRGDERLFWDRANWQALCQPCHHRKTGAGL
jgi:5-methylcytosine-specific restriction protein A